MMTTPRFEQRGPWTRLWQRNLNPTIWRISFLDSTTQLEYARSTFPICTSRTGTYANTYRWAHVTDADAPLLLKVRSQALLLRIYQLPNKKLGPCFWGIRLDWIAALISTWSPMTCDRYVLIDLCYSLCVLFSHWSLQWRPTIPTFGKYHELTIILCIVAVLMIPLFGPTWLLYWI